ncbi:MAG: transposase zinc-binding domain-containing protein [Sandaracinaceae bacterium]|nr:transposase zinc-binding domain-containing protein [Sandaracinaceae bacterium]
MRSHGSARFRCDDCAQSRLLALSGKRRAFCPRCVGRKVADTAKRSERARESPVQHRAGRRPHPRRPACGGRLRGVPAGRS